ncbi:MAG: protoporphyrinogen oxidase, partial [Chlamydiae bacterium]|nr:protoporphyrinogen oxidase [Chlamydiota bacterium]
KALLSLLDELNLSSEIQYAQGSTDRYIYLHNHMHKLPKGPLSFLSSVLTRDLIFTIIREITVRRTTYADESVGEFIARRFGSKVLDRLFDPLVQGIYAVDPYKISIKSCFPFLKQLEDQHGSVVYGMIKQIGKLKKCKNNQSALFSIHGGVEKIIKTIQSRLSSSIYCNQKVLDLQFQADKVIAKTENNTYTADFVFIALPVKQAAKLLGHTNVQGLSYLANMKNVGITSALVGYPEKILPYEGFGYLVSSKQQTDILGAVFDSNPFNKDHDKLQTRITVMLRGTNHVEEEKYKLVYHALSSHLGIKKKPDLIQFIEAHDALPVMEVGHEDRVLFLKSNIRKSLPRCYLLGNYLSGVSVNDCIRCSQETVLQWALS